MSKLTIQNVVGGGNLGVEINLYSISDSEFEHFDTQYEPECFPGVVFRSVDLSPTIMLYRSGKFNIAGGKSKYKTFATYNQFYNKVQEKTGFELQPDLEIRYYVTTGELGRSIDLAAAAMALGIDETEYEPEQFPGLFYRPNEQNWFVILFASGSIVVDGEPNLDVLESAYEEIDRTLSKKNI